MTEPRFRPRLPAALASLSASPWAILPTQLDALVETIAQAAPVPASEHPAPPELAARRVTAAGSGSSARAIAVLPLRGTVLPTRHPVFDYYGVAYTPADAFGQAYAEAMRDPLVGAVVIEADSGGGTTTGVPELGAMMAALRGAKPTYTVVVGMLASAAYWIGAQTDTIVAAPSAFAGSIGVFMLHREQSKMFADWGIAHTIVRSVPFKAEANPYEPLSPEAHAALQATVDEYDGMFVHAVARARSIAAETVRADYGSGRLLTATQAKRAGLVDRIATFDEVITSLGASLARPATSARADVALPVPVAADVAPVAEAPGLVAPPLAGPLAGPTPPAPAARSHPVLENENTAANGAAPSAPNALAAERGRTKELRALAAEHHIDATRLDAWIDNGTTVAAASHEILSARRQQAAAAPVITGGQNREANRPWASLGEQLQAIARAHMGGSPDPRLFAAVSGASATVGPDGAFLIHPTFSTELLSSAFETGVLASRCSDTEIGEGSDGLEVVQLEDNDRRDGRRWGGVRVYRRKEAQTVEASKPALEKWSVRLEDMMGIAHLTDRLIQDAPAMQSVFSEAFNEETAYTLDGEIFGGSGVGECLGIHKSRALVVVPKVAGQAADSIVAQNFVDMLARVPVRMRKGLAWFINQELEMQLPGMYLSTGANSGQLVYMPPGGISGAQYGNILGVSVVPIEHAEAPGDQGDVTLAALSQYKLIKKGGLEQAESIHVRFVYAERTFRWIARVNGAPKQTAQITPAKGSAGFKLSPFVTLAPRA